MLAKNILSRAAVLLASLTLTNALLAPKLFGRRGARVYKRTELPSPVTDFTTIKSPTGANIRYKMPGKEGICETTPGVNSYSGYIDLSPDVHIFFWFFESRRDPANDDFTLWLNGGPGSDSLIGLFEELGPCRVYENLTTYVNPWSWNEVSNMLFLSQPVGAGNSYQDIVNGSLANFTGATRTAENGPNGVTGAWPGLIPANLGEIDTTDLAAIAAWHVLQAFHEAMPQLQGNRAQHPKKFNLWTESYGGHYGPSFFEYFYEQNELIKNGSAPGCPLEFNSLGLINALISEKIQADYYPEMAVNNTYGIKAYNDTVYSYAKFANHMIYGCLDQLDFCIQAAQDVIGGYKGGKITSVASQFPDIASVCSEAGNMCRDNVEVPYYAYGNPGGIYDIRHPRDDPTPPDYFADLMNQGYVQKAIGSSVNYTLSSGDIFFAFAQTGDFIYPNFLIDLQQILASGVRVALMYGDADYICNWLGGQAVSLQINHTHKAEFNAAGYAPLMYNGVQYGEVRERGNFSFTRVYEAGHEIPYYQPQAALAMFQRVIEGTDIATGLKEVTADLTTNGPANTTHINKYEPPPSTDTANPKYQAWSKSLIESYDKLDQMRPPPTPGPKPPSKGSFL